MKARVAVVALVLISAAFQMSGAMSLRADDPILSDATFRDFYPSEDGLRWSGGRSAIVFPDPGPGISVRVEVRLSGWRPPGVEGPRVVLSALGRSVASHPGAGAEVVSIETTTSGWWRASHRRWP